MQQTKTYKEQGRIFLAQAFEELEKGDFPQASEKGWGAAAQMVKANARARGRDHYSHQDLFRVVNELVEQTGDGELATLFNNAGFLHTNFYENAYKARAVKASLQRVIRFVDKAEALLPSAD